MGGDGIWKNGEEGFGLVEGTPLHCNKREGGKDEYRLVVKFRCLVDSPRTLKSIYHYPVPPLRFSLGIRILKWLPQKILTHNQGCQGFHLVRNRLACVMVHTDSSVTA